VLALLEQEFTKNKSAQIILFHESIDEAMSLYSNLPAKYSAIVEHSKLPNSIREDGLELFRKQEANVLVSVKSLIEGFNVPAVDVGIIVASSSSVRQRIQSMGRVMRKHMSVDGNAKTSSINVLYIHNTVDDTIYRKLNWDKILGVDSNFYYRWHDNNEIEDVGRPPHLPPLFDTEVDVTNLHEGDTYIGAYEGTEYSVDHAMNVVDLSNIVMSNSSELAQAVLRVKGPGRFKITKSKNCAIVLLPDSEKKWIVKFVKQLEKPLMPIQEIEMSKANLQEWINQAKPGDIFPEVKLEILNEYSFKLKRGGVIVKKVTNGAVFARTDSAMNKQMGLDATKTIGSILTLKKSGLSVSKLIQTTNNLIISQIGGRNYYICKIEEGFEFKQ